MLGACFFFFFFFWWVGVSILPFWFFRKSSQAGCVSRICMVFSFFFLVWTAKLPAILTSGPAWFPFSSFVTLFTCPVSRPFPFPTPFAFLESTARPFLDYPPPRVPVSATLYTPWVFHSFNFSVPLARDCIFF